MGYLLRKYELCYKGIRFRECICKDDALGNKLYYPILVKLGFKFVCLGLCLNMEFRKVKSESVN